MYFLFEMNNQEFYVFELFCMSGAYMVKLEIWFLSCSLLLLFKQRALVFYSFLASL